MGLFTERYAPQAVGQVVGQDLAMQQLSRYIETYKAQKKKIALLSGPIGCGKTSSVYALAKERNYEVLELNASDLRNKKSIESFLSSALGQRSLFFKPKMILIDEIDSLSGIKDRGAIPALIKAVAKSSFPIVATAVDLENKKLKALKKASLSIPLSAIEHKVMLSHLESICEQEEFSPLGDEQRKALSALARHSDGDMRAALLDLQVLLTAKDLSYKAVLELSDRKRTQQLVDALRIVFKSSSVDNSLGAFNDVDLDPQKIMLWIEYNLPKEYLTASALAKAYEALSRADIFHSRIRRWQHWRFLVYVYNYLTAGISAAKDERNPKMVAYKQSSRLLKIWMANQRNAKKKAIAQKLAHVTHTSTRVAMQHIDSFRTMSRGPYASAIIEELELESDEVAWLRK